MKLCAIVLAAGFSSRMGCNKLLMDYHGYPMAEYILYNLRRNQKWFDQIVVVSRLPFLEQLTHRYGFTYLHNPEPERGMGHSLALGVQQTEECDGFLMALADMPDLREGTIHTLCERFLADPDRITVPVFGGKRGNPVIFPRRLRAELEALDRDWGGRELIRRESDQLARVQVYDPGVLRDIDTREDLRWK